MISTLSLSLVLFFASSSFPVGLKEELRRGGNKWGVEKQTICTIIEKHAKNTIIEKHAKKVQF